MDDTITTKDAHKAIGPYWQDNKFQVAPRNHAKGEIHFARLHKDAMIEIVAFLNEREYQIDIFLH